MKRLLLLASLFAAVLLCPRGAGAEQPSTDGWWSVTNSGSLTTPPPPGVPSNGLYVANNVAGPSAIAALTYAVPSGSQAHRLLLHVAGTPVLAAPPVACLVTGPYQPAFNGRWAKRPAYDCRAAQVAGQPDASKSSYGFDVGGMVRNASVSVVILAGGKADSMAFNPPGADSLDVAPAPGSPIEPVPSPDQAASLMPAPVASPPTPTGLTPTAPAAPAPALGSPAALLPVPAPAVASPLRAGGPPGRSLLRRAGAHGSGVPGRWAKSLALVALLGFLGAYALGYGILGGRIGRVGLAVDED